VELTPGDPQATCTATYEAVPASKLQVIAHAEGSLAARADVAVVEITCDDGSTGLVVMDVKDFSQQTLPQPLSFLEATTCTVGQTSTGVRSDSKVTASAALDPAPANGPLSMPARVDVAAGGSTYTLTITDVFGDPGGGKRTATFPGSLQKLSGTLI